MSEQENTPEENADEKQEDADVQAHKTTTQRPVFQKNDDADPEVEGHKFMTSRPTGADK